MGTGCRADALNKRNLSALFPRRDTCHHLAQIQPSRSLLTSTPVQKHEGFPLPEGCCRNSHRITYEISSRKGFAWTKKSAAPRMLRGKALDGNGSQRAAALPAPCVCQRAGPSGSAWRSPAQMNTKCRGQQGTVLPAHMQQSPTRLIPPVYYVIKRFPDLLKFNWFNLNCSIFYGTCKHRA